MDPTTGPFSWLQKILGMQQGGNGGQFGSIGGGIPSGGLLSAAGGPMSLIGALGGSSGPAANNNMPISGVGPGLWPGGQPNQAQQGGTSPAQNALMGQAQNLIKGPQLQPAPWMQLMPLGTMRG